MVESKAPVGYVEVLVECPFCGGYVPDDFECLKCGSEIMEETDYEQMMFVCSICREDVGDGADECEYCGAELE